MDILAWIVLVVVGIGGTGWYGYAMAGDDVTGAYIAWGGLAAILAATWAVLEVST